jgi:hypothetical protein
MNVAVIMVVGEALRVRWKLHFCRRGKGLSAIAGFRIDAKSGRPTFTGQFTAVGSPAHLVFG